MTFGDEIKNTRPGSPLTRCAYLEISPAYMNDKRAVVETVGGDSAVAARFSRPAMTLVLSLSHASKQRTYSSILAANLTTVNSKRMDGAARSIGFNGRRDVQV